MTIKYTICTISLYSCACDSYELTKADMARINFAWNRIFWKTFKVSDVNIINAVIDFTGHVVYRNVLGVL